MNLDAAQLEEITNFITGLVMEYGVRVLAAIAILVVGRMASGLLAGWTQKALTKANTDVSLRQFATSLVRTGVFAFAVIAALSKLGVETTSFVAVLGAAGLAVGLALQGSLSNFAAGVLILLFKPFEVGDVIDGAGSKGKVAGIGILTTTLNTPDNQKIIVPNSALMSGTITNVNAYDTRRVDLVAGIGYGDDIGKAKSLLEEITTSHDKVLAEPKPTIEVSELADSSVNFVVRPWVATEDYWTVYFDLTRSIKEEFDRHGISIPFPQADVHVHNVA